MPKRLSPKEEKNKQEAVADIREAKLLTKKIENLVFIPLGSIENLQSDLQKLERSVWAGDLDDYFKEKLKKLNSLYEKIVKKEAFPSDKDYDKIINFNQSVRTQGIQLVVGRDEVMISIASIGSETTEEFSSRLRLMQKALELAKSVNRNL